MCFVCGSQLYTDRAEKHLPTCSVAMEGQIKVVHGGQSLRLCLLQMCGLFLGQRRHIGKAACCYLVQVLNRQPRRNQCYIRRNVVDPRRNDGGRPLHCKSLSVGHLQRFRVADKVHQRLANTRTTVCLSA